MTRYIVYRSAGALSLGEEDPEPQYVFIREDDIKTGFVVPGSDPMLCHEPEGEITANSVEEARRLYREQRDNAFG